MSSVVILLIGTGTLSGIIANSSVKDGLISLIDSVGLPSFLLAPIAGILMSAATASTTSGSAVASNVFGQTLLAQTLVQYHVASMIHSGAKRSRLSTSRKLFPCYCWKR